MTVYVKRADSVKGQPFLFVRAYLCTTNFIICMRIFQIAFLFLFCAAFCSCSRAIVEPMQTTVTNNLAPRKKVFVQLIAPYASEEETLKLVPELTSMLRHNGLVVSSSVENKVSTDEWRTRAEKRLVDFQPDYILKVTQARDEKLPYRTIQGAKTYELKKHYTLSLLEVLPNKTVWQTDAHGSIKWYGHYHRRFARSLEKEMVRIGLLAPH